MTWSVINQFGCTYESIRNASTYLFDRKLSTSYLLVSQANQLLDRASSVLYRQSLISTRENKLAVTDRAVGYTCHASRKNHSCGYTTSRLIENILSRVLSCVTKLDHDRKLIKHSKTTSAATIDLPSMIPSCILLGHHMNYLFLAGEHHQIEIHPCHHCPTRRSCIRRARNPRTVCPYWLLSKSTMLVTCELVNGMGLDLDSRGTVRSLSNERIILRPGIKIWSYRYFSLLSQIQQAVDTRTSGSFRTDQTSIK